MGKAPICQHLKGLGKQLFFTDIYKPLNASESTAGLISAHIQVKQFTDWNIQQNYNYCRGELCNTLIVSS